MIDFYNPRCPFFQKGNPVGDVEVSDFFFCFATFFEWILVGVNMLRCNQVGIENDHI